jgi:hypothetical protein
MVTSGGQKNLTGRQDAPVALDVYPRRPLKFHGPAQNRRGHLALVISGKPPGRQI